MHFELANRRQGTVAHLISDANGADEPAVTCNEDSLSGSHGDRRQGDIRLFQQNDVADSDGMASDPRMHAFPWRIAAR